LAVQKKIQHMAKGRLFYLMGPSGSGKDSLMRYTRQALKGTGNVIFAHRYITRPLAPDKGENYIALSEEEFVQRLQAGCFAMHWDSHGYHYGIGIEIDCWLALGLKVILNGSRAYLEQVRSRYPDLCPIAVQVTFQHLQARLLARNRETGAKLEERLRRAVELDEQVQHVPGLVILNNDGTLEEAGGRLVALLLQEGPRDGENS
jgi:ribose 1,5-bisphosphokinase